MKNFKLNLKGLYGYRQSLLSRSPQPRDNREMSERRPSEERTLLAPLPQRFARYAAILIMLLTLGVGQMWAGDNCNLGSDMTNVYMPGTWNEWSTSTDALTKVSGNEFYGVRYVTANTSTTKDYTFKLYISWDSGSNYTWKSSSHNGGAGGGTFTSSVTTLEYWCGSDNATVKVMASSSGFVKLDYRLWGNFTSGKDNTSHLYLGQTAVNNLSASLTADATSVQGGSTTTVRGGCTGGSGDYGYSYEVTCGGSDVTASVLSGSGENRTFTAPLESTSKTYRVTITATEQNSQLTGLGFTSTNSTYTDITVPGITAPTVTMKVDKVNVNQFTVTGTIMNYNGYGSRASDLSEVGFYIGATKYTATYKSGNTFTKTITGLAANASHANVKAFAKNPLTTGYSGTQTVTTLADADYDVKVRVAHGASAPKVYAWTDADSYGGSKMENGTYGSQSASEDKFEATTYDWYTYKLNNKYEKFLIYETGDDDKSEDFAATRTSDCYWYNKSGSPKAAQMTCPKFEPQIVINDGSTETLYEMSGDGTVTKSQTLSAGSYTIKVMYNTEYYGKASSSIARTGSTSSNSISGMVVDGAYINLTADLAGTYTFSFNTSSKTLSVTYPEAYRVTYSKNIVGSDNSTISAPTASYNSGATSVTSGTTWIPAGTTVNFSAPAATSGYTWKGWYSNTPDPSNWATNRIQEGASYNRTVSAAATIYAVYDEDDYTVTVNKTTGGSITTPTPPATSVTAHVSTPTAIAAAKDNEAWHFDGWTKESGSVTFTNASNLSTTIKATATSTIQANFKTRYGLVGSRKADGNPAEGMPNRAGTTWENEYAADFEVISFTAVNTANGVDLECTRTLLPNREYKFQVYDRTNNTRRGCTTSGGKTMPSGENWELNGTNDVWLSTAGYGDYTFKITKMGEASNYYPSLEIVRPASSKLTLGWGHAEIDALNTVNSGNTGGSVTAQTTESGNHYTITNNQYVANGGSITFTAAPATGYTLEGWYNNSDYAVGHKISNGGNYAIDGNTLTVSSISANLSVYAKFVETSTAVTIAHNEHGHVEISGATVTSTTVGKTTTRTINAVPNPGYYFAGWTVPVGADFSVDDATEAGNNGSKSTTLRGLGAGTAGTITANFVELEKVYFRNWNEDENTPLWSNVYVYFSISYEDHGGNCAKVNSSADFKAEMRQEGTSNVYWAYVPRATTRAVNACDDDIAFSNHDFAVNTAFYQYEGVMRGDYEAGLDMFVPTHGDMFTRNSTNYYNGFWKHHNVEAGSGAKYYMKRYKSDTDYEDASDGKGNCQFTVLDENTITYNLRIDGMTASGNRYKIDNPKGISYITKPKSGAVISGDTVKTTHCASLPMTEYTSSTPTFVILPSAEGMYTITIDQSGDRLKLSVDYPISKDDYILEHTYNDGTSKTSHSYIIKPRDAAGSTVSMFLYGDHDKDGTIDGTLKLKKCTSTDGGTPTWSSGVDVSGYTAANFKDGSGVYQFDVVINTTTDAVTSVGEPELYKGKYYIKTDIATGGWVNYTENELHHNDVTFNASDASTFDYYYCQWAASGKNVKCVIANDYNIQLTDTLKADGIATLDAGEPKVSENTNIRFSYNSKTNELKRAYLASVSGTSVSKVFLKANAAEYVYDLTTPTANDLYTYNSTASHFHEAGNWTYQMDVDVYPSGNAKAAVQTNYPTGGATRTFVSNTVLIGDGEGKGSTKLRVRLVYDFKTNHLVAAYIPTDAVAIDETINLYSDLVYLRAGAGESTQITFAGGGSFANVKKVYGTFEFKKDSMAGQMSSWTANDYRARRQCRYYFSFPFNVKVSDIFGVGEYGNEYIIQTYNGAKRAEIGWFQDTETFWETLTIDDELQARQGYALMLDREEFNRSDNKGVWTNIPSGGSIFLYFPSKEAVNTIDGVSGTFTVPAHEHKSGRVNRETGKSHDNTDSNWNLIGLATYGDVYTDGGLDGKTRPASIFKYNPANNGWTATDVTNSTQFMSMYAYMAQWAGTFRWTFTVPASVAARQTSETKNKTIQLNLIQDDVEKSRAYVKLNEEANADFVLNEDMSAIINSGQPNIYTYAGVYDVAFNNVPDENQTINVGVVIPKAGTYTFSMPENINGTVTLIDEFEQTRTNLSLSDYEVMLPKGTTNDRFKLEINVKKIPTAIDGVEDEGTLKDGKAHKFLQNGVMYILQNGCLYDAQGRRVE